MRQGAGYTLVQGVHDQHGGKGDHDGGVEVRLVNVEGDLSNDQQAYGGQVCSCLESRCNKTF